MLSGQTPPLVKRKSFRHLLQGKQFFVVLNYSGQIYKLNPSLTIRQLSFHKITYFEWSI